ncbi:uncharacterized protein LOC143453092 [Clavelina lepadiformis]|uniref:Uncharacterized protein n=1 Tax=Clavelina lepadiformis TaxID=159417 RepID=A0ABP0G291_CLALP
MLFSGRLYATVWHRLKRNASNPRWCNVLGNTKKLPSRPFTCSSWLAKEKIVIPTFPTPITSLRNWAFGWMVRKHFQPDFNLREFCELIPMMIHHIVRLLAQGNKDELKALAVSECLENLSGNWESLPASKKTLLESLEEDDFYWNYPKIKMLMENPVDNSEGITAIMHIEIYVFFFVDPNEVDVEGWRKIKVPFMSSGAMEMMKFPVIHRLLLKREVSKGVEDCWRLQECYDFPNY